MVKLSFLNSMPLPPPEPTPDEETHEYNGILDIILIVLFAGFLVADVVVSLKMKTYKSL
jgi:hypothetical protein